MPPPSAKNRPRRLAILSQGLRLQSALGAGTNSPLPIYCPSMDGNSACKVFKAQSDGAAKSVLPDYREVIPQSRAELLKLLFFTGANRPVTFTRPDQRRVRDLFCAHYFRASCLLAKSPKSTLSVVCPKLHRAPLFVLDLARSSHLQHSDLAYNSPVRRRLRTPC